MRETDMAVLGLREGRHWLKDGYDVHRLLIKDTTPDCVTGWLWPAAHRCFGMKNRNHWLVIGYHGPQPELP